MIAATPVMAAWAIQFRHAYNLSAARHRDPVTMADATCVGPISFPASSVLLHRLGSNYACKVTWTDTRDGRRVCAIILVPPGRAGTRDVVYGTAVSCGPARAVA